MSDNNLENIYRNFHLALRIPTCKYTFIWDPETSTVILPSPSGPKTHSIAALYALAHYDHDTHPEGQGWYNRIIPAPMSFDRRDPDVNAWPPPRPPPPPPPVIPSGATPSTATATVTPPSEIPIEEQCTLCGDHINARFSSKDASDPCTHGTCTSCLLGMWRARQAHPRHLPSWFKCPFCRREIVRVGLLVGLGDTWVWDDVLGVVGRVDADVAELVRGVEMRWVVTLEGCGVDVVELTGSVEEAVGVGGEAVGGEWEFWVVLAFVKMAGLM